MFFKADSVIEIIEDEIVQHSFSKQLFRKIKKTSFHYIYDELRLLNANKKNSVIILNGQQLEIKSMSFPKCSKHALNEMIINELSYFYDEPKDVGFSYIIEKKERNNVNILLFCSSYKNISKIEEIYSKRLKAIYLVQLCALNYYKNKINGNNYVFVLSYKGYVYLLYFFERKLVDSLTENIDEDEEEFNSTISKFIKENDINHNSLINDIYYVNYSSIAINKELTKAYNITELDNTKSCAINTIINSSRRYTNGKY